MKRVLVTICALASIVSAMDLTQIRQFIRGSVTTGNATMLGFDSADQTSRMDFGPALDLAAVHPDSLNSYPASGFSVSTKTQYLPVLVDGSVRCFAVIDSTGKAVSLGYVSLAKELSRAAELYGIDQESIKLYSATQINSYLVSIPTISRSANLSILTPGWLGNSRSALPEESATIEQIRRAGDSK